MKLLDREFVSQFYPGSAKHFTRIYRALFGNLASDHFGLRHRIFLKCYFLYKRWLEDPFLPLTKKHPHLFKGGHILDVGACIGYTAALFSRSLDAPCSVYAFEPEPSNQIILGHMIKNAKLKHKVILVPEAVGSRSMMTEIWKNPMHHGDHRIATAGLKNHSPAVSDIISVRQCSLDDFCKKHEIVDKIAFVKIDVQGYEAEVLRGMGRVILSNPKIVLALEYSPAYLELLGENNHQFFDLIEAYGLKMHFIRKNGSIAPFTITELDRLILNKGYIDLLCSKTSLI